MSYGPLLVKHGDSRARERHQLIGYQVDEHIRHRAVERLEGEPSQVARTSADATEGHLGHSLRREACDEAVAQVASAVDVDVAHRVVVGPRKDREEVEVLRGSLHRVVRVFYVVGVAGFQLVVQALHQLILCSGRDYLHASLHVAQHSFLLVRRRRV